MQYTLPEINQDAFSDIVGFINNRVENSNDRDKAYRDLQDAETAIYNALNLLQKAQEELNPATALLRGDYHWETGVYGEKSRLVEAIIDRPITHFDALLGEICGAIERCVDEDDNNDSPEEVLHVFRNANGEPTHVDYA